MIDRMKDNKPGEVAMVGQGLDGKPYPMRKGTVTVLHIYHDADCLGAKGRPDLCRCKPDIKLGPLTPALMEKVIRDCEAANGC